MAGMLIAQNRGFVRTRVKESGQGVSKSRQETLLLCVNDDLREFERLIRVPAIAGIPPEFERRDDRMAAQFRAHRPPSGLLGIVHGRDRKTPVLFRLHQRVSGADGIGFPDHTESDRLGGGGGQGGRSEERRGGEEGSDWSSDVCSSDPNPQSSSACISAYPARTGSDFRITRKAIASVAAAARLDAGLLLAWAVTSSVVPRMPSVQRSSCEKLGRKPS